MERRKNLHLATALLAVMLLFCPSARLVFAEPMGSLRATFLYADGSGHALDGTVLLYQVASLSEGQDGAQSYVYTEDFIGCSVSLEEVSDAMNHDLAAALAAWISEQDAVTGTSYAVDPEEGTVAVSDLDYGLYLLTLQEGSTKSYVFEPFLVSIPYQGNHDVDASPKVEVRPVADETIPPVAPNPTATPTKSPDVSESPEQTPLKDSPEPSKEEKASKLPQTGQLFWPIPFLAGGGLLFCLIGAVLRRTGRRKGDKP